MTENSPPTGPQSPAPGSGPSEPPTAPVAPRSGSVPPGGWQQPIVRVDRYAGQYASWWTRAGAYLIDGLVIGIPAVIVSIVLGVGFVGAAASESSGGIVALILAALGFIAILVVVSLIYAPLTMMRSGEHNGQTWGKQLLDCRVVRADGQPMDFWWSVLRQVIVQNFLFWGVGQFFLGIPTLLNYLWPLWDDQDRCLHDMVCDTRVIRA